MTGRSLEGATVLVTGARGFLGRHLCSGLQQRGALVHRVTRSAPSEPTAASRWWRADLEDIRVTQELLAAVRPDLIVHLAGRVSAAPASDLVLPTFHSLLASTVNLLIAATELGCGRLILPGSLEEPVGVASEVAPTSPYAAAKWGASAYARMFHRLYGTPVVVARLFMTYGPGQEPSKVVPSTILALLRGERPRLSYGDRPLDWIFVDDAVEALLTIAEADGIEGATIDVGTGEVATLRTVVRHILDLVDPRLQADFGVLPDRPFGGAVVADARATHARLGWRASTALRAGLERTVEWYAAGVADPARGAGARQEGAS